MVPIEPERTPEDAAEQDVVPPAQAAVVPTREPTPLEVLLQREETFRRERGIPEPTTRRQIRARRRELGVITHECLRAQRLAEEEVAENVLGQATFGLPADCADRFHKAAWERYRVAHHWMGCVMTDENGAFASCYNHVMDREITRRHGSTALEELWHEICDRD